MAVTADGGGGGWWRRDVQMQLFSQKGDGVGVGGGRDVISQLVLKDQGRSKCS